MIVNETHGVAGIETNLLQTSIKLNQTIYNTTKEAQPTVLSIIIYIPNVQIFVS